jgi:Ca2+-binding RTX toxin-like protein
VIEKLETRRLLADISLVNGTLRIVGTAGNDQIDLALFGRSQFQVLDAGTVAQTFDRNAVRTVSFAGLAGDDVLIVGRVPVRTFANGGTGKDAISAAQMSMSDTLIGGDGDDYLFGGDGPDTLDGGLGYDGLLADGGNDLIRFVSDDMGDDTVSGGGGRDTADAAAYQVATIFRIGDRTPAVLTISDFIFEDVERLLGSNFSDNVNTVAGRPVQIELLGGDDIFTGGRGNDTIVGGLGRDEIAPAGGDDLVIDLGGDSSADILAGGTGTNDIAVADAGDTVLVSVENRRANLNGILFNDDGTITLAPAA